MIWVDFSNYSSAQEALTDEQRTLSKALRGKRSKRAAKARKAMARRWRKIASKRKDRNHQISAALIATHGLIGTEDLAIKTMAASAKGSIDKPGKRVKQKAGLNRAILDATPGRFLSMLAYKAAEAGCELVMIDTRTHRPSQTCPGCGCVEKKPLQHREHRCGCGFIATRDQAAALHMLTVARQVLGREPARAAKAA